jgi:hypothetical protein
MLDEPLDSVGLGLGFGGAIISQSQTYRTLFLSDAHRGTRGSTAEMVAGFRLARILGLTAFDMPN